MPVSKKRPAAKAKVVALGQRKAKPETIRQETVDSVEEAAWAFVKEALEKAFELDGLRGALTLAHGMTLEYDRMAGIGEKEAVGDEKMLRGLCASHILTEVVPHVMDSMAKLAA